MLSSNVLFRYRYQTFNDGELIPDLIQLTYRKRSLATVSHTASCLGIEEDERPLVPALQLESQWTQVGQAMGKSGLASRDK